MTSEKFLSIIRDPKYRLTRIWLNKLIEDNNDDDKIFFGNFLLDMLSDNIDELFLLTLLSYLENYFKKNGVTEEKYNRIIDKIVLKADGHFCLVGSKIIQNSDINCCTENDADWFPNMNAEQLCRAISLEAFFRYNLSMFPFNQEDIIEVCKQVEHGSVFPMGLISNGKGFAWATPVAGLPVDYNSKLESYDAITLRNHLGSDEPIGLMLIIYPPNFEVGRGAKPTFLDGLNSLFRVNQSSRNWGMTVNIENGEEALEEIVHCKVPLVNSKNFEFKCIIIDSFPTIDSSLLLNKIINKLNIYTGGLGLFTNFL